MRFKADEIASVIQQEIEHFQSRIDVREVGRVIEVGDGIARVYGLSGVMSGEMVEFPGDVLRVGLQPGRKLGGRDHPGRLPENPGRRRGTQHGQAAERAGGRRRAGPRHRSAGQSAGRRRSAAHHRTPRRPDSAAPGVAQRQPVKQPLQTGIKAIDAMTPIGRGQRELIIGDRKTGKTAVCIDTIINQKTPA